MSSAPMDLPCPECGAVGARQISAGAGFAFKGSGFYLTDYGKNAHRGTGPEKKDDGGGDAVKGSDTKASDTKASGDAAPKPAGDKAPKAATSDKPAASKPQKPTSE